MAFGPLIRPSWRALQGRVLVWSSKPFLGLPSGPSRLTICSAGTFMANACGTRAQSASPTRCDRSKGSFMANATGRRARKARPPHVGITFKSFVWLTTCPSKGSKKNPKPSKRKVWVVGGMLATLARERAGFKLSQQNPAPRAFTFTTP